MSSSSFDESTRTSVPTAAGSVRVRGSKHIAKDEKDWIAIQKNTFTNWVNEQLRDYEEEVTELETGFEDGLKLIHLVESASTKKVRRYNKKPKLLAQKLENVTAALKVIEEDGIHLVNIGNEDIVNGNIKLILGLIWRLILHYQISSSGSTSGKQLLLIWLRNALPDLEINNVTSDWNNGIALSGLLEFCKPGLKPDYKRLNPDEGLSNVTDAMSLAEQRLRIPKILPPESFVNPYVDDLSMMTYLSQFTKLGSPGEAKTMEIVNDALSEGQQISNFNEDWIDGKTLCHYVERLAPGTIPEYDRISEMSAHERAREAFDNSEEKLGIKKIITPEEMVDNVNELSLMAYVLQFLNAPSLQSQAHTFNAEGNGLRRATQGKVMDFHVHGRRFVGFDNLRVDVMGPSSDKPVNVEKRMMGDRSMRYMYTPLESGTHSVSIKHINKHIPNSPFTVQAFEDVGDITVSGSGLKYGNVMQSADFIVDPHGDNAATITAIAEGPTKPVPVAMEKLPDGSYKAEFVPTEIGQHQITVMVGTRALPGCPFTCKVGDPSKCVLTPHDGARFPAPGKDAQFTVDTSEAGLGEIEIKCTGPDGNIPVNVQTGTKGHYDMSFTPQQTGDHTTNITFNGENIPSSPYTLFVADPSKTEAHGKGLYQASVKYRVRREIDAPMEIPKDKEVEVTAIVTDPDQRSVSSTFGREADGLHHLKFTPYEPGSYTVDIRSQGKSVEGSPFTMSVVDPLVSMRDAETRYLVRRELDVALDCTDDDFELSCSVKGPDDELMQSTMKKEEDGLHHVKFVPYRPGLYKVIVRCDGEPIEHSPFLIRVGDPDNKIRVVEAEKMITKSEVDLTLESPFQIDERDVTATVQGPGDEKVASQLDKDKEGKFHVKFLPNERGQYKIYVRYVEELIEDAPYIVNVTDQLPGAKKCEAKGRGLTGGIINERCEFKVDTHRAGPGSIQAWLSGVKYNANVDIAHVGNDTYACHYITPVAGAYVLTVRYDEVDIPGSPFKVTIQAAGDASRCIVEGAALKEGAVVFVAQPMELSVNSSDAGPGQLHVRCEGTTRDCDVTVFDNKDSTYRVQIQPVEVGNHLVYVEWGGKSVQGSPFLVRVGQLPDPSKVNALGPGLDSGLLKTFKGNFLVDTKGAGPGTLKVRIHGPRGAFKVEMYRDTTKERSIGVRYNPTEVGRYVINIKWVDQHIPGSPFEVTIVNTKEELDSLNELNDNIVGQQNGVHQ